MTAVSAEFLAMSVKITLSRNGPLIGLPEGIFRQAVITIIVDCDHRSLRIYPNTMTMSKDDGNRVISAIVKGP